MENSAAQPFEAQWKDAFRGAVAPLPESAWTSIENTLTRAENETNKRTVIFYQRLAAALLLICVVSASTFFWQWQNSGTQSAGNQTFKLPPENKVEDNSTAVLRQSNPAKSKRDPSGASLSDQSSNTKRTNASQSGDAIKSLLRISGGEKEIAMKEAEHGDNAIEDQGIVGAELMQKDSLQMEKSKALTTEEEKELVKKLLGEDETIVPEKKKPVNSLWASVGLSGGSYSPEALGSGGMAYASQATSNLSLPPMSGKSTALGTAYSLGVMMGKQLARRWIIQTGVAYRKQQVDYESNVVRTSANGLTVFDAASMSQNNTGSSYSVTTPYTLSNASEYLSVPVQIGYVVVDRKLGFAVNTGVSTDIFLRNTLSDKSGSYSDVSQSGESSGYRTVSMSGITNAELSIRFADHYKFSLVPGVRYSFSNVMNDNSGYQQPLIVDLGFRFRYIFK